MVVVVVCSCWSFEFGTKVVLLPISVELSSSSSFESSLGPLALFINPTFPLLPDSSSSSSPLAPFGSSVAVESSMLTSVELLLLLLLLVLIPGAIVVVASNLVSIWLFGDRVGVEKVDENCPTTAGR